MKQKGLAPILIVLIIALAIGGYLMYKTFFYCPSGSGRFYLGDSCHGTGAVIPQSKSTTLNVQPSQAQEIPKFIILKNWMNLQNF